MKKPMVWGCKSPTFWATFWSGNGFFQRCTRPHPPWFVCGSDEWLVSSEGSWNPLPNFQSELTQTIILKPLQLFPIQSHQNEPRNNHLLIKHYWSPLRVVSAIFLATQGAHMHFHKNRKKVSLKKVVLTIAWLSTINYQLPTDYQLLAINHHPDWLSTTNYSLLTINY